MAVATLALHVVPRAARTEVAGRHGEAVKIRLAAPPVDGAANEELIRFLAERLGVARGAVTLKAGKSGRRKTVAIAGVTTERAVRVLLGDSPTSASRSGP
jgi:uncharacterized protein